MKNNYPSLLGTSIGIALNLIIVSLFIVSLITINISLSAKLIIGFFAVLLFFIFRGITDLIDTQTKCLYSLRKLHVSVESQRLDPKNVTPSRDILAEIIKDENAYKDPRNDLMGFLYPTINIFCNITYLLAMIICTALLLYYWDQFDGFLSSLITTFHKAK